MGRAKKTSEAATGQVPGEPDNGEVTKIPEVQGSGVPAHAATADDGFLGLKFSRHFTTEDVHPYDEIEWELRDAIIKNWRDGTVSFEQRGVEFPTSWSMNATTIVAQKYFRGRLGTPERERSVKEMIDRVADTITDWGIDDGYFADEDSAETFRHELKHLLVNQKMAFNSPVWFNVGVHDKPQSSACFILAVEDRMDAILNWYVEEGKIFKGGSGSGINLSTLRSSKEHLSGGGTASGPVSFMRGADASAGTIKCLHEDTEVVTDRGVVPIRDVAPGSRVLTRHGFRPVREVHDNGVQELVKVTTALGDEVLCTPEHRFRVRGRDGVAWRRAGELRDDDHVLVALDATGHGRLQPLEPVEEGHHNEIAHDLPEFLDEAFALWLGWVHGDGSITTRESANFIAVQLGDEDPELVARYKSLLGTLFGERAHLFDSRHADKPDASTSVRFCSTQVIRFLEANGLRKGAAHELAIPQLITSSPATVRAAFLAGLFEADGCIDNGYPNLSTVSERLARDVHRVLLSIGIPSTIRTIDSRGGAYGSRPVHTVRVVGGEGVRRFAKLVGFVSERKSKALDAAVERKDASPFETQWVLPHVVEELDDLWRNASDPQLRRAIAPYCRYETPRSMSLLRARALVERFPEEFAGSALERFANGHVYYVPVMVAPAGTGATFDLTVDDVHEYLVHNLVTHNSGGTTRRAAKMVVLNANHPDVEEFIWCKAREERKARVLREAGFDMDIDGLDAGSVQYQNANNSVRVDDDFMRAWENDEDYDLTAVTTGETVETMKARDLMRQIAEAAWECADPGMQYDTTINRWHTCPESGRINASNPCSEYVHLDNSACNLASLNLKKFYDYEADRFDVESYKRAIEITITAQEILVGNSSYPTDKITETAKAFRELGIGYSNLGALLMSLGLAYDSDEGRAWCSALTAVLTGQSYRTSAEVAKVTGPFAGYAKNAKPMLKVIQMHRDAVDDIDPRPVPDDLLDAAKQSWDEALATGKQHGFRNSQASVLAPTGCLVGGTLVPTERGLVRLTSLGDPAGEDWQDLNVDVATDEGPREATQFYVNGLESVVTVTTARGYRIQGTPKHRIKVVTEDGEWAWKRFADIAEGDRVPLSLDQLVGEPREVRLPPLQEAYWTGEHHATAPRAMSPQLAEFLGYFMGDGSLHARGIRLCVDDADLDVVERLKILGKELFNLEAHVSQQAGYTEVAFHSVRLVEWWQACDFAKHEPRPGHSGKGYEPHIPDAVLHSNDRAVYAAFLRGLYEADGTVTMGYPHWMTSSSSFTHDVQRLLLAMGYPTTRKFDTPGWGDTEIRTLRLLNSSYNEPWLDEIGFIGKRKNDKVEIKTSQQAARKDHIPITRALVDRVAPDNGLTRRNLLMGLRRSGSVSRRLATTVYEATGDAELGRLLGFFYDTVATAELGEDELTYDLSVPDNVTYIANGFVSHNTISFLMDCDTTGIEPDLGLVKTKKLVGGGSMSIVNQTVPEALRRLGYADEQVEAIVAYIDDNKTLDGAPAIREEHKRVFQCSMGDDAIHYMGHVKMMAAAQPFLSGAISKTVNMPETVTVEDVEQLYYDAWQMGIKAIAIYRDNCKAAQPLSVTKKEDTALGETGEVEVNAGMVRRKLPKQRPSQTISFRVADAEGYLTAGEYPGDGLGEIFVKLGKQGSTLSGVMDAFAISVSLGLQYGVPLEAYVSKFMNMRFEPAGMTDDDEIRFATSIVDYLARKLAIEYLPADKRGDLGIFTTDERTNALDGGHGSAPVAASADVIPEPPDTAAVADAPTAPAEQTDPNNVAYDADAPLCYACGIKMTRAGSCHVCEQCGATSGCS